VAVVAAVELEDQVAPRERARHPDRAHRGLGAARHEAEHRQVRHPRDDHLREVDLEPGGHAEARAAPHRGVERVDHDARRVAEHERPPREHEVEVGAAVRVVQVGALAAHGDERLAADAAERAHRRVDAAGEEVARARHDLGGGVPGEGRRDARHRPVAHHPCLSRGLAHRP
jgi:hypothetical protein